VQIEIGNCMIKEQALRSRRGHDAGEDRMAGSSMRTLGMKIITMVG
jgi:hypothetical protein